MQHSPNSPLHGSVWAHALVRAREGTHGRCVHFDKSQITNRECGIDTFDPVELIYL